MILPVYAYGQPVLLKKAQPVSEDYPQLAEFIENMWETMYNASGVGLAAPQVGKSLRIFIVDTKQVQKEGEEEKGIKKVFINPEIIEENGKLWAYEEGCLSIPDIRGDVMRKEFVFIKYLDENFEEHTEMFGEMEARVIQHEYDHLEGILFTELLKPLKKRMVNRRLQKIKKGDIKSEYRMRFVAP